MAFRCVECDKEISCDYHGKPFDFGEYELSIKLFL